MCCEAKLPSHSLAQWRELKTHNSIRSNRCGPFLAVFGTVLIYLIYAAQDGR